MWYELGKQKFDRQKNFSREMKGIEETMLKYLGEGDIIFLAIPLSTSTRRPGQDNPMSQVSFSHFFVSREQTKNPEGVLSYKRLMGMCRWMGSHFHDWIDYNGVTFSIELLEWVQTFSEGQQTYQNVCTVGEKWLKSFQDELFKGFIRYIHRE